MQFYTDVTRESDAHALPDAETFMRDAMDNECCSNFQNAAHLKGWYWWRRVPGWPPHSDPSGPFSTEKLAIEDAREALS